ncbi:MAG: TRAP transporter substrate-binding protein [Synergistota bacterium]|jgi:tripartite ATP-independent transporter DctP family solute receptor|nr:TRAP transporter substrate-binding protein [Synergistota bacterium]OPZ41007.1 MAG: 2,3-diketo-L-gulonate-binding periplasmic protein YiaO precursor [Synergistetes bacterium ADurb.BinA166]
MRKFGSVAALAILALALVCGTSAAATDIKLAHVVNENDAFHVCALKFKEVVEAESGGELTVSIYPNAQLGDERNLLESMRMGVVDSAIITGGPIMNFMPKFGVFDLPFLFSTPEQAYRVLDGEIGKKMLEEMAQHGWKGLAYGERGFRNLTNSKHPVSTPEDMKGLKIRLMQNPVYVDSFRALGANAVPMAWTEALTALQQGAIDGQENPLNVIVSFNLFESQKYLAITRHAYAPNVIMMSMKTWEKLSPELQSIVQDAAVKAAEANRTYDNEKEAEWLQFLKDKGMEVTTPDTAAFREAVKPVYEKYEEEFGKELVEAILAE